MHAHALLDPKWFALASLAALGASPVSSTMASAEVEFPYIAYVSEPESYVRSGPGRRHYPTLPLPVGYAVEVYRHDGNGWCAIRPPEGSFGLLPIQQLEIVDQRTARLVADGVPSRVGSAMGDDRAAVQIILERGETVALAAPPSPTSPWVRIAPPAGEFRWIAACRLSRTPPTELKPLAPADDGGWQTPLEGAEPSESGVGRIGSPEPSDDESSMSGDPFAHLRVESGAVHPLSTAGHAAADVALWQPSAPGDGVVPVQSSNQPSIGDDIEIIAGSPAALRQAQHQQAAATPAAVGAAGLSSDEIDSSAPEPGSAGQPRIRFEGLSALGPLGPRVAEMHLRLSQIVIGAPAVWQLGGLRDETAALLANEQSSEDREQLRELLNRITTFEAIQTRYRSLPPIALTTAGAIATAAGADPAATDPALDSSGASGLIARVQTDLAGDDGVTPTPGGPAPSLTEPLYDAVGTLKPVVSRRPNAPRFALIDDHGDVVTFVTAAPDVNLQAYLGQRIGVRGSRGFMPEFRRAHVTASRVTTLDNTVVK
jgi:hypothetical protein